MYSSALRHLSCTLSSAAQPEVLALLKQRHTIQKMGPVGFVERVGVCIAATVQFAAKHKSGVVACHKWVGREHTGSLDAEAADAGPCSLSGLHNQAAGCQSRAPIL